MTDFSKKTAAVIGLARAGAPAAKFLLQRGAKVTGYDSKPRENLSAEALELEKLGAQIFAGEHNFENIENCDLIVLSPGLKIHFEPLKSVIENAEKRGAEVIGELELASRFCPCPIIGVTGTKGKSTTTKLITEMLRACDVDAISAGNTGTPLISILPDLKPQSWAVVEVSSFQLEKAPTFRPKIAVLLSLLEDHQDYHPDLEQYWQTKLKIFANMGEQEWAVVNMEDERVAEHWQRSGSWASEVAVAGRNSTGKECWDIYWKNDVLVSATNEVVEVLDAKELPLNGTHNRANVAAAVGASELALQLSARPIEMQKLTQAIRNFQTLPHRLEIVAQKNGVTWVNDSQSTIPDAAIAALKSFPAPVSLILGGRAKIGAESYEALMGEIREKNAKIFLIGEAAEMLADVAAKKDVPNSHIFHAKALAEAVALAKMNCAFGETVVLSPACASFDQFSSYEARGETFRALAQEV